MSSNALPLFVYSFCFLVKLSPPLIQSGSEERMRLEAHSYKHGNAKKGLYLSRIFAFRQSTEPLESGLFQWWGGGVSSSEGTSHHRDVPHGGGYLPVRLFPEEDMLCLLCQLVGKPVRWTFWQGIFISREAAALVRLGSSLLCHLCLGRVPLSWAS